MKRSLWLKYSGPGPAPAAEIGREIKDALSKLFVAGFWFCHDCNRVCERVEGEHGQPAHCSRCGLPRIEFSRLE